MKKKNKVVRYAIIAALGGFLFGFDIAVISGAEQAIQELFQLDEKGIGFTVAIALIGTVTGSLFAGKPADIFGRKVILVLVALFFGISAIGSSLSQTWQSLLVFRFIGGLAVGFSSVIGPMYIAEISPSNIRGRLVGLFQINIVSGILIAFFSNYLITQIIEDEPWRWMLGVEAFPAIIFFLLFFLLPASPRWLILRNRKDEALRLFEKLSIQNGEGEIREIEESIREENLSKKENLFSSVYKFPVMCAVLLAIFNQMSGINALMYYAPRIFQMTGASTNSALLQSVSIGFTNLILTYIAIRIMDKFGRKKLLLVGSVGMTIFLGLVAKTLFEESSGGIIVLFYLLGFVASFAFSQGAVIWVFLSEIFPNKVRAKGQSFGSSVHWVMATIVSLVFPIIAERNDNGGGIAFIIFSASMLIQFFVVLYFFPETKGKSLEQLQKEIL